jgi:hypothetical protein
VSEVKQWLALRTILFIGLNVGSLCEETFRQMGKDGHYHYVDMWKIPLKETWEQNCIMLI